MQQLTIIVLLGFYLLTLTAVAALINVDSTRSSPTLSATLSEKVHHAEKPLLVSKKRNLKSSSKTTTTTSKTITPAAVDDDDAGSTNILTSNANTSGTGWVGLQAITAFFVIIAAVAFALFLRPTTNRSQYQPL